MGGGSWSSDTYTSNIASRRAAKIDDFEYTKHATKIHDSLDPRRINKKPAGILESRDSAEHPDSTAVLICFDVTGSNRERAVVAQRKLPELMTLVTKYLPDPQIAVAANDDFNFTENNCIQISEFESDIRIDDHIRNIMLVGLGGGNDGESYDLLLYAAARKVAMDCLEKRGRKGYMFMYADEPFFKQVKRTEIKDVFGDNVDKDIPLTGIIDEVRQKWHLFVLSPAGNGLTESDSHYRKLFGDDSVITLQDPSKICEVIGATIGLVEAKVTEDEVVDDLISVGVSKTAAKSLSNSLALVAKSNAVVKANKKMPAPKKSTGAAKL